MSGIDQESYQICFFCTSLDIGEGSPISVLVAFLMALAEGLSLMICRNERMHLCNLTLAQEVSVDAMCTMRSR